VTLKYDTPYGDPMNILREYEIKEVDDPLVDIQRFRLKFVNDITMAMEVMNTDQTSEAPVIVNKLIDQIKSSDVKNNNYIKDLLKELEDQVTEALSRTDYYSKWGKHYLLSLLRAHLLQQCNNFKDPAVQNYAGAMFTQVRDKIDDIFLKIPPPKPSVQPVKEEPPKKVKSMKVFYNASAGCIDGNGMVAMADGKTKLVKEVCKDDEVLGVDGQPVKIVCVIKILCRGNKAYFAQFECGLRITPWHPIRIDGEFYFPSTIGRTSECECSEVYNFVLESQHVMKINGIECVTLGHGFQEEVVKHPYFGTSAVIKDLQKMKGWESGLVELREDYVERDPKTGLIKSITRGEQVY